MKNTLYGFKNRFKQAEERISKFEDRTTEVIKSGEQQQKK